MKRDQEPEQPVADNVDPPSDSPLRDSGFERGEPIPLDVIASELRRQSELGAHGRKPPAGFRAPRDPIQKAAEDQKQEPDAPLISPRELEQLMADGAAPEPAPATASTAAANQAQPAINPKGPRKSSDVLSDRLVQVRRRAETAERQRAEVVAQNQELRQQVANLRETMENGFDDINQRVAAEDSEKTEALRRELELVRTHAAADLDTLRKKLLEASQASDAARNVELEAELQALRQEAAVLRHAVKEKDKVLEDLAAQCRGLEDVLEDRDREMDRLCRDLEQGRGDPEPTGQDAEPSGPIPSARQAGEDSDSLYAYREKENTEILDGTSLIYLPDRNRDWKTPVAAGLGGLVVGLLLLEAVFLFSGRGEIVSSLLQAPVTASSPVAAPSAATAVQSRPSALGPAAKAQPEALAQSVARAVTEAPAASGSEPGSATPAGAPSLRDRLRGGAAGPEMIALPSGEFLMGEPRAMRSSEATPTHQVRISPFLIAKTEVSFADYDRFAQATGRDLPDDQGWGRGRRPVINVSWDDAVAYARWLSQETGKGYRLPSEAEWEYAARGGVSDRFWWGFSLEPGRAVCFDCGTEWSGRRSAAVASLPANPFGLHDTAGNVMEWVTDCHNPGYRGAPADGSAWLNGDCAQRIVRGGAYNKPSTSMQSSARNKFPRVSRLQMLGFRVVRDP